MPRDFFIGNLSPAEPKHSKMSLTRGKPGTVNLHRRVRARRESSEDLESLDFLASYGEDGSVTPQKEELAVDAEVDSESISPESESVSFGALLKAQTFLDRPSKSSKKHSQEEEPDGWESNEARERKAGRRHNPDVNRPNKHAPAEVSSKKAVSRKREVVAVQKREARDPRFVPLGGSVDDSKISKAYSFLDDYRENEMKELKGAIKASIDEDKKEKLKRTLMAMESRKKDQMRKQKEQEVLDSYRRKEKELVKQGKRPFYLKKVEQKKRVLMEQYGKLKGKQLDRVIERRRKKIEGKEKKKLPFARRTDSRN